MLLFGTGVMLLGYLAEEKFLNEILIFTEVSLQYSADSSSA